VLARGHNAFWAVTSLFEGIIRTGALGDKYFLRKYHFSVLRFVARCKLG
jgi:hypothetical protein